MGTEELKYFLIIPLSWYFIIIFTIDFYINGINILSLFGIFLMFGIQIFILFSINKAKSSQKDGKVSQ